MMWWILLSICVIASVQSAPADVNSVYKIVESDKRTELLRQKPFIRECDKNENFSKSLCFAMYDASLSFNSRNLSFDNTNNKTDPTKFCGELKTVLPDTPMADSAKAFKTVVEWLKDTLKKNDSICRSKCLYEDQDTYETRVTSACQFLLNQYAYLNNFDIQQKVVANKTNLEAKPNDEGGQNLKPKKDTKKDDPNVASAGTSKETKPEAVPPAKPVPANAALPETPLALKPALSKAEKPEVPQLGDTPVTGNATEDKAVANVETPDQKIPDSSQVTVTKVVNSADVTKKTVVQAPTAPIAQKPEAKKDGTSEDTLEADKSKAPDIVQQIDVEEESGGDNPEIPLDKDMDKEIFDENVDKNEPFPMEEDDDENLDYVDGAKRNNNNNIKLTEDEKPQEPPLKGEELVQTKEVKYVDFEEDPDSNFFTYLCGVMFLCVVLYILHQNRQKILALFLEGRRGNRRSSRSRGGSKAAYSKLDCNLEEAITSNKSLNGKSMDIIY